MFDPCITHHTLRRLALRPGAFFVAQRLLFKLPMPRRFDLICFDWDGTLFDSTALIVRAIQQAVADVGGQQLKRGAIFGANSLRYLSTFLFALCAKELHLRQKQPA